jgi:hypothetical protein
MVSASGGKSELSTEPENQKIMKHILIAPTLAIAALAAAAEPQPISLSPAVAAAMPSGPVAGTKITEAYARLVARDAYFWAWPLVNMINRRVAYQHVPEMMYSGPVPMAPLNQLTMLTDYFPPDVRV